MNIKSLSLFFAAIFFAFNSYGELKLEISDEKVQDCKLCSVRACITIDWNGACAPQNGGNLTYRIIDKDGNPQVVTFPGVFNNLNDKILQTVTFNTKIDIPAEITAEGPKPGGGTVTSNKIEVSDGPTTAFITHALGPIPPAGIVTFIVDSLDPNVDSVGLAPGLGPGTIAVDGFHGFFDVLIIPTTDSLIDSIKLVELNVQANPFMLLGMSTGTNFAILDTTEPTFGTFNRGTNEVFLHYSALVTNNQNPISSPIRLRSTISGMFDPLSGDLVHDGCGWYASTIASQFAIPIISRWGMIFLGVVALVIGLVFVRRSMV